MALELERATYNEMKWFLMDNWYGKHAVISGDVVVGKYDTYEQALEAGYEFCGVDKPFLVQEITDFYRIHTM